MATCSCIRGNFNIYVKAIDKDTLVYHDLSEWMTDDGYIVPDTYSVTITPPATSKSTTLTLKTGSTNQIGVSELGSLKDGAYCFEVTSCGISYKKSVGLFPSLECCLKQAYATQSDVGKVDEVDSYLKRASINVELNNLQTASSNLSIAKALLENMQCDCNC